MNEEIREWVRKQIGNKEDHKLIKKTLINRGYDPEIFDAVLREMKMTKSGKTAKNIKDKTKEDIKESGIRRIRQRKLKLKLYKILKMGIPILIIILLINSGFDILKERKDAEMIEGNINILQEDSSVTSLINMDGSAGEDKFLAEGWWASAGPIRWGGNNHKYPALIFEVHKKSYSLETKMLIPEPLVNKNIEIIANDKTIGKFSVNEEKEIIKNIDIPSRLIKEGKLKIVFKSDFWNTLDYYPDNALNREQTIAFDYVILREK